MLIHSIAARLVMQLIHSIAVRLVMQLIHSIAARLVMQLQCSHTLLIHLHIPTHIRIVLTSNVTCLPNQHLAHLAH